MLFQATRHFAKGEFVVEYAGELIDIGSAKDREAQYSLDTSKGCYMYYFAHRDKQYWSVNAHLAHTLSFSRARALCAFVHYFYESDPPENFPLIPGSGAPGLRSRHILTALAPGPLKTVGSGSDLKKVPVHILFC